MRLVNFKLTLLLMSAVFLSLKSLAQIPNYLPTTGLLVWYPFNGNTNDYSGNNNHGVNNGATLTTDRFGNVNSAFSFNGSSSYIQLPNIQPPQITISFWFKINSNQSNQVLIRNRYHAYGVLYNWTNANDYNGQGANKITSYLFLDQLYTNRQYICFNPQNTNDNNWHHLAFTYDGLTYNVYTDSNLVYSSDSLGVDSIFYQYSPNGFTIGRDGDFNGFYFNGLIDDVSIYDRALSPQEVNSIYTQTALPCQVTIYDTTHVTIYDTTHITVYDTLRTFISVTDTLVIDVTISGLTPPNNINTLKVYPNPAKDKLIISTGSYNSMLGYTVKVTNALGQIVFLSAINQQQYILDLSTWTGNGTYFLSITDPINNIIEVKKIVLQ